MNRTLLENAIGSGQRVVQDPDQCQVVFATPSLTASVCLEFLASTTRTVALLMTSGITHGFILEGQEPYRDLRGEIVVAAAYNFIFIA